MGSANRLSTCNFVTYWVILSLCLTSIGCSSKTDQENAKDDAAQSAPTSEQRTQVSLKKQLERLTQENEELRKSQAESLALEEEMKRLRQQNDESRKAIAEVLALIEKSKSKQENGGLKKAINKLIDVKEYSEELEKQKAKTDALIAKLDSAVSTEEKLDFIESLSELSSRQDLSVIGVVLKALDDPDPKVGRVAIELLDGYQSPEILPVVEHALGTEDEQIRMDALLSLSGVNSAQVSELLVQALSDPSKGVRSTAIEVAEEHRDLIQLGVLEEGIASQYDDVKYRTAAMLMDRSDHSGIEILFNGLKDTNPDFREEINDNVNFLINMEFESYDEAITWWSENKNNYDEELFEKEPN